MESDNLSELLPVALTPDDIERNPEFTKLLKALTKHILPSGAFAASEEDVREAKEVLNKQKQRWLLQHTLYTELQELILHHQLQSSQSTSSANSEFYGAVADQLTQAEIVDYVDCNPEPGSDVKLFGLTAEKLEQFGPKKLTKQAVQQRVIPDLESRLRHRCETLVSYHSSSQKSSSGDGRFELAKASQLPTIIANEHQELVNMKQLLKKEIAECRKLQMHYCELLLESFRLLNRLITDHRLKSQPENDTITGEWLAARSDALCLKIKVLELQLMYDTYYAGTVDALKVIRSELDKSIADTEQELSQSTTALRTYESVGTGFDAVVQEFTRLRSDIENKRWALHELKKHPLNTATSDADRTLFS